MASIAGAAVGAFNEVKAKVQDARLPEGTEKFKGYAVFGPGQHMKPYEYVPDMPLGDNDVEVKVKYCGFCHTDVSFIKNELSVPSSYPFVPGHEIVGTLIAKGPNVKELQIGQRVGIGFTKAVCHKCQYCLDGKDNLCSNLQPTMAVKGAKGGFADRVRADAGVTYALPDSIPDEEAGPLLCAGITVFAPLINFGVKPGMKVGIVGLGGLGHLFVQFAAAMGCEVWVFSANEEKEQDAKQEFGAAKFINWKDKAKMQELTETLDFLAVTLYGWIDPGTSMPFIDVVKADGTICLIGWFLKNMTINSLQLVYRQRRVVGSNIGSSPAMKQMLDFVAQHNIHPKVEVFPIHMVNEVYDRFDKAMSFRYRAVMKIEGEIETKPNEKTG